MGNKIKTLNAVDWRRQRHASLTGDITPDTTIGEVVQEFCHTLNLPRNVPYAALYEGRKLNKTDSVADAALRDESELTISPDVRAG